MRATRHPEVGRAGYALPAGGGDGAKGKVAPGAGFDFHKGDNPAFRGDEVDLANRGPQAGCENSVPFETQP